LTGAIEIFVGSLAGMTVLVLLWLSRRWTENRKRGVLQRTLRRQLRTGEEDSLGAWLKVPQRDLDQVSKELAKNPFTPLVDTIEGIRRSRE
jgi:hypothetical protein